MSTSRYSPLPAGRLARIIAVVRPLGLDAVMEALSTIGPSDVQVEEVRGYGRQKSHLEFYEESGFQGGFLPKVRVEFIVSGAQLEQALDAVCGTARTGRIGDGKIFVQAIEEQVGTPVTDGSDAGRAREVDAS